MKYAVYARSSVFYVAFQDGNGPESAAELMEMIRREDFDSISKEITSPAGEVWSGLWISPSDVWAIERILT